MSAKISIIGAGQVGGTTAHLLFLKGLGDIVLLDVIEGIPQGKALDIAQSGVVEGCSARIIGTNNYKDTSGSDIVFITAGFPRKPGMDRLDLLKKNAQIIKEVVENIIIYSPNCIIIVMTNPVDVLTYYTWKLSGFPANRVMGQAGVLDTARYKYFISQELDVPPDSIDAIVLGGHGNTMVPLPRLTTINNRPLMELLSKEKIDNIVEKTRNGGAEIVNLLKTGSAYYAPSSSAVVMIEAILKNKKEIIPVSAYLNGQYGIKDIYIGVPAVIGRDGVEEIVELELTEEELSNLRESASQYKEGIKNLPW